MKTTLQEISESSRLNRKYWNAHVKFSIALIRTAYSELQLSILKKSLERKLLNRKNYEYLQ